MASLSAARAANFGTLLYGGGDPRRGKQRESIYDDELAAMEGCSWVRALSSAIRTGLEEGEGDKRVIHTDFVRIVVQYSKFFEVERKMQSLLAEIF